MPSPSDVAQLRQAQAALADRVEADLRSFWASLNLERPEASRDALLRYVPVLTTAYGDAAATVAADWYDEMRVAEDVPGRFAATMAEPVPTEYVERRVRFGASHLFTEAPGEMLPFLLGVVNEYALQPGRDTITGSVAADPRAAGWHREASPTACKFCRALVGKGGVYRAEASASFAAHPHCGCSASPSWDADAPSVPAGAYVASERMDSVRWRAAHEPNPRKRARAQQVLDDHRARTRDFIAAMDA